MESAKMTSTAVTADWIVGLVKGGRVGARGTRVSVCRWAIHAVPISIPHHPHLLPRSQALPPSNSFPRRQTPLLGHLPLRCQSHFLRYPLRSWDHSPLLPRPLHPPFPSQL